jgi:hypothetical protein
MAVGGQGPSVETAILDPSAGWSPLGNSRTGSETWRLLRNVEIRDGGMQFRPALRNHGGGGTVPWRQTFLDEGHPNEPLVELVTVPQAYIGQFTTNSDPLRIAITKAGVYRYAGNSGAWVGVYPEYATGTISWSTAGTTVTGVGTDWTNANVGIFDVIELDDGSTVEYHAVASRNSATNLSLVTTPGTTGSGRTYKIRKTFLVRSGTEALYGLPQRGWAWLNGELYLFCNEISGAIRPAVIRYQDLLDPTATPTATVIYARVQTDTGTHETNSSLDAIAGIQALVDGRIVLATYETAVNNRLRFSSQVDPTIWNTSPAGFVDVVEGGDTGIRALGKLGRTLTIHFADGLALGNLTGISTEPIATEATREVFGCHSAPLLKTMFGQEFFMGMDGVIYSHSSGSITPVSDRLRHELAGAGLLEWQLSPGAWIEPTRGEYGVWLVDDGWAVNVRTGEVRYESYPISLGGQWALKTGLFGTQRRFASPAGDQSSQTYTWAALSENYGSDAEWTTNDIDVDATTFALDFGAPGVRKTIDRVSVWVRNPKRNLDTDSSYTLAASISADGDATADQSVSKTVSVPADDDEETEVQFLFAPIRSAESWAIRLAFTDDKLVGLISKVAVKWTPVGETEAA